MMLSRGVTHESAFQCYEGFKRHLDARGFTVFPVEFECSGSDHPFVDIAAKMGGMYWAFEYKSENDSISRGLEQLRCYSEWFDYVVIVSERLIDHRNSLNYKQLKELGAGLWSFDRTSSKRIETANPKIQQPIRSNRNFVARRFRFLTQRSRSVRQEISSGSQSLIYDFY
ncbi:MAG: hypothetical protein ACYC7D_11935 [Nitrososphaerales archaeon]